MESICYIIGTMKLRFNFKKKALSDMAGQNSGGGAKKFLRLSAFWKKRGHRLTNIFCGLAVAVLLFFGVPKLYFDWQTSISIPSGISVQEKNDILKRWKEIRTTKNPGRNNSLIYNDIGILRSGLKDYTGAIRAFKTARALNPDDPRFSRNIGIAYSYINDFPNSEKAFLDAFRIAPTQPEYWLELSELYTFKMKDTEKTRLFYIEALQKSQDNIEVVRSYAAFLTEITRDYNEAIKYWQIMADRDTQNKMAYLQKIQELKLLANIK